MRLSSLPGSSRFWRRAAVISLSSAAAGGLTGYVFRPEPGESATSSSRQWISGSLTSPGGAGRKAGKPPPLPQTAARLETLRNAGIPSRQIAAALELASLSSVDEIRDLLDHSDEFPDSSAEEVAIGTLLRRWLELDPKAAMEYCRQQKPAFLARLTGDWHRTEPEAAEAFARALPAGDLQTGAWTEICLDTFRTTPDKAWEMIGATPGLDPNQGTWLIDSTVGRLVRQDVEKAMAAMDTMPPAVLQAARKSIAAQLAVTDPERGWEWVRSQPNSLEATGALLGTVMGRTPGLALDFMKSVPPAELDRVLEQSAFEWQAGRVGDFADSLRNDRELDLGAKQAIADRLFGRTMWSNPEGAGDLVPLMSPERLAGSAPEYARILARRQDAAAAGKWVESLPEGDARESASKALQVLEAAESKAGEAGSAESLGKEFSQGSYISPSDPRLEKITTDQLGQMLSDLPENQFHRTWQLVSGLAQSNPAPLREWLEKTPVTALTGPAAAQFSSTWAANDLMAAAEWVKSLPPGDLARVAAGNVARQYNRFDPEGAARWIEGLPEGTARDAARQMVKKP